MNNEQKEPIEQVEEPNQDENIDETEDAEKTEAKTAEESTEAEEKPKKKNILQRIKDFIKLYRIKTIKELYKLATSKPETPSEAKAKTDAEYTLLTMALVIIDLLFIIISPFVTIFMLIITPFLMTYLRYLANKKSKRNFCEKCEKKIDYQQEVACEVINYDEKSHQIPNNPTKDFVWKERIANVKFTCTCSKCGTVKEFNEKFTVVQWRVDSTVKEYNLGTLAENYFKL